MNAKYDPNWTPEYEWWRHGGWYVTNIRYPSGAVGCVCPHYDDAGRKTRKWRIACDERPSQYFYPSRDAAARAELELTTEGTKA